MIIAPYRAFINIGEVYTIGYNYNSFWKVKSWETYKGLSNITLEAINHKGEKLDKKDMEVLSCHWEDCNFQVWPFSIGK